MSSQSPYESSEPNDSKEQPTGHICRCGTPLSQKQLKHFRGTDISDRSKYGLVLDVGEMSCERAALVAVMNTESLNLHE